MADGKQTQQATADVDDCSLYGSWIFSVLGAAIAVPVGIKTKSLGPLVFYGSTGAMLDIWVGLSNCERAKQERAKAAEEERLSKESSIVTSPVSEDKFY